MSHSPPIQPVVDIHHHILPPRYVEAVGAEAIAGLLVSGKLPEWTPQVSLDVMERHGIAKAYVSMSAPGVPMGGEAGFEIVRAFNDDAAALRDQRPDRFGTFSYLPLPDAAASLDEISRVFDHLGTDGVSVLSSYGEKHLGDPAFTDVFDALNRRAAVVFVHPAEGPGAWPLPDVPAATLDFPIDTSRAILSLLTSGTFSRCPDIRFIFSHAGGVVPFLAARLARLERMPQHNGRYEDGVIAMLSRQLYDTALSANAYIFDALMRLAGPQRILFGSDFPFAPEDTTTASLKGLRSLQLDPEHLQRIERTNAVGLMDAGVGASGSAAGELGVVY